MTSEIFLKGHIFVFFHDNTDVTGDIIYKCKNCNYRLFKNKRTMNKIWEDIFSEYDSHEITDDPMTCDEVIIKIIIE